MPELPLARIKKIMKSEDEVKAELGSQRFMISAEAPVMFAKACEIFVLELTLLAWNYTEESKRRTLQRNDIVNAVGCARPRGNRLVGRGALPAHRDSPRANASGPFIFYTSY